MQIEKIFRFRVIGHGGAAGGGTGGHQGTAGAMTDDIGQNTETSYLDTGSHGFPANPRESLQILSFTPSSSHVLQHPGEVAVHPRESSAIPTIPDLRILTDPAQSFLVHPNEIPFDHSDMDLGFRHCDTAVLRCPGASSCIPVDGHRG